MLKICLTLVLSVSLSCLAQPQRRRYSVTQYNEGAARTQPDPSSYQSEEARFDPRNQYPNSPRNVQVPNQYLTSTRTVEARKHYSTTPRTPQVHVQYSSSPRNVEIENYSTSPRTVELSSQYPSNTKTIEVSNQYPTNPRSSEVSSRNKYRRKPKQTYYPKVVTFYQKPTTNNGYEFKYLTADGVQRAERGYLSPKGVWTVEGSVTSLVEGDIAVVQTYIADGSGYKSTVRRYSPEKYRSLDDFLPWSTDENSFEDDNKLGSGAIDSLVGG